MPSCLHINCPMMSLHVFIISLLILASGCHSSAHGKQSVQPPNTVRTTELSPLTRISGTYHLITLNGKTPRWHITEGDRDVPGLHFNPADMELSGFAGCNRFFGTYQITTDSLETGVLMSTKMACTDMALEHQFMGAINRQKFHFQATENELILHSKIDTLVLRRP